MFKVNQFDMISMLLILLGSINWGIIALFNINLIKLISFNSYLLEKFIYVLFFAGAINIIFLLYKLFIASK